MIQVVDNDDDMSVIITMDIISDLQLSYFGETLFQKLGLDAEVEVSTDEDLTGLDLQTDEQTDVLQNSTNVTQTGGDAITEVRKKLAMPYMYVENALKNSSAYVFGSVKDYVKTVTQTFNQTQIPTENEPIETEPIETKQIETKPIETEPTVQPESITEYNPEPEPKPTQVSQIVITIRKKILTKSVPYATFKEQKKSSIVPTDIEKNADGLVYQEIQRTYFCDCVQKSFQDRIGYLPREQWYIDGIRLDL